MELPRQEKENKAGLPPLFYRFMFSRVLTGISISSFILFFMWDIVSRYHSVFLAGMMITIYVAVALILSFPIGHLIDRLKNTTLNFLSSAVILGGFAVLITGGNIFSIYAATAISVFGQTIKLDSFSAIIKKHVQEGSFKKANSFSFAANSASSLLGTLIGGFSIVYLQGYFVYLLLAITAISIFLSLPIAERAYKHEGGGRAVLGEMKAVGSFVWSIAGILILAFFLNGLLISLDTYSSGIFNLLLKSSPIYYTAFNMCVPLGMMTGTPVANMGFFKRERPMTIALMMLVFSPFILILALSRSPIVDVLDAFAIGLVLPLINIPIITRLMRAVPHEIYGKVMAFLKIFTGGASPVMGSVFSTMALFFSIPLVLFWVAVLVVPLAIYSMRIVPRFFRFNLPQPK